MNLKYYLLLADKYGRMHVVSYDSKTREWKSFKAGFEVSEWEDFPREMFPKDALLVPLQFPGTVIQSEVVAGDDRAR